MRIILLFPFSVLYWAITYCRNKLFDFKFIKSYEFELPVIGIGNISTGGTGKTPMIEFLIRLLQDKDLNVAVLSRGYKRKTKGFVLANDQTTALEIGDEAFQLKCKFKDLHIAVSEKRVPGIRNLLSAVPDLDVILLDDAFQHRYVKPGLNILLSDFNNPFFNDLILPSGNLRESRKAYKRADLCVFTKTHADLAKEDIDKRYDIKNREVYFSYVSYTGLRPNDEGRPLLIEDLDKYNVLLFTGIGNASYVNAFLRSKSGEFMSLKFSDHHDYDEVDFKKIKEAFKTFTAENSIVITTEKDISRIKNSATENLFKTLPLYYLLIETKFHPFNKEPIDNKILDYVGKN